NTPYDIGLEPRSGSLVIIAQNVTAKPGELVVVGDQAAPANAAPANAAPANAVPGTASTAPAHAEATTLIAFTPDGAADEAAQDSAGDPAPLVGTAWEVREGPGKGVLKVEYGADGQAIFVLNQRRYAGTWSQDGAGIAVKSDTVAIWCVLEGQGLTAVVSTK